MKKSMIMLLTCLLLSTVFYSCNTSQEPELWNNNSSTDETEYIISVNTPKEIRTRGTDEICKGDDGLLTINRTINKLWYCVYNKNTILYTNTLTRNDTGIPFKITFKLESSINPSDIYLFFWAGNQNDKISIEDETEEYDFNISYNDKTVTQKKNSEDDQLTWLQFDSFAGYYDLNSIKTEDKKGSVTLKRPFAQIHILTDDFLETETELFRDYPDGVNIYSWLSDDLTGWNWWPTKWHYDTGKVDSEQVHLKIFNSLSDNGNILRTNYKNRKFDYIGCISVFAPSTGSVRCNSSTNKNDVKFLNISLNSLNSNKNCKILIYDDIRIMRPNNRYVIYNKKRSDGGTGFFNDDYWHLDIDHDASWTEPDYENETDKF